MKWFINVLAMGFIFGLILSMILGAFVIGIESLCGTKLNLIYDLKNILCWPLGFWVSYRLWPPPSKVKKE